MDIRMPGSDGLAATRAICAGRLRISHATVKTHVSRVLTKLALRDRAQLVVWAYETGRVSPGWHTS
jgi:DNA-binding CsgD family transcriptional regulator